MTDKKYCSRDEAARRLGVSPQTISNHLKEGNIPFTESKGPNGNTRIFIPKSVIDALASEKEGEKSIVAQVKETRATFDRLLAAERETLRAYSDYMDGLQKGMHSLPRRMETLSALLDTLFRIIPGEFTDEEKELLRMSVEGLSLEIMSCTLKKSIPATQKMLRLAHSKLARYPRFFTDTLAALNAEPPKTEEVKEATPTLPAGHMPVLTGDRIAALQTPIKHFSDQISNRTYHCLRNSGIETVAALILFTKKELMDIRNFGNQCLSEVELILEKTGFSLGSRWVVQLLDDNTRKNIIWGNPAMKDVLETMGKQEQ